jgi:hypothetical protein
MISYNAAARSSVDSQHGVWAIPIFYLLSSMTFKRLPAGAMGEEKLISDCWHVVGRGKNWSSRNGEPEMLDERL